MSVQLTPFFFWNLLWVCLAIECLDLAIGTLIFFWSKIKFPLFIKMWGKKRDLTIINYGMVGQLLWIIYGLGLDSLLLWIFILVQVYIIYGLVQHIIIWLSCIWKHLRKPVMQDLGIDPSKERIPNPATLKYTEFLLATAAGKIGGGKVLCILG